MKHLIDSPEQNFDPTVAYSEIEDKIFSIRTNRWRYVYNPGMIHPEGEPYNTISDERRLGFTIDKEELYDIIDDPKEAHNIIAKETATAAELKQQLESWMKAAKAPYKRNQQMDEKTMEELKSLGYVQ